MIIKSRFPGECKECGGRFSVGEEINWVAGLGARHHPKCPETLTPKEESPKVDLSSIANFVTAALQRGLKSPKLRFLAPKPFAEGSELRLSLAGEQSRFPGSIQVKVNDSWIGRVHQDGSVHGPLLQEASVLAALREVGKDPAAAAKQYAALLGRCSFCGLTITDEGSVTFGYGPICAERYGLPHVYIGTPAVGLAPVPEEPSC